VAERVGPKVYSIAAHRGFADALVAGLLPRYADPELGLSQLTLLLPSARAARTISEAFIRLGGAMGMPGMLMPRMAMVGDLDLDETLGSLLDPLGASDIPPAVEPTRRWLELAELLRIEMTEQGRTMPGSAGLLRLARETAATMDRLLVEQIEPDDLMKPRVLDLLAGTIADHWKDSIRLFARVQARWLARLAQSGEVDTATRRNMLFERAAKRWREVPPDRPIVAAGVTSAAPALARLLRVIADLPNGSVILPDLDLQMDEAAWDELGLAGQPREPDGPVFARRDALTHPQYHLKLLLGRMGVNRQEVEPWHRKGIGAAPWQRSHAISSLFLPPEASKAWVDLPADKRQLGGVRLLTTPNGEAEAQAIALIVREALETPEQRVAVVTPDRVLARRVVRHLERWNIAADDSAGQPLNLTAAGRLFLQLAELASEELAPVSLIAALAHPLVKRGDERREWLENLRSFERRLRGPRPAPGMAPLEEIAREASVEDWWAQLAPLLDELLGGGEDVLLADALDRLVRVAEALAGDGIWSQEDGRALARLVEDLRSQARASETRVERPELHAVLRDAMEPVAVRPPYGGHPRVAIYGLLESRMTRADLVICGGLNEGTWPGVAGSDPLLAPAILRALGVPGNDFRIGLSAHDLAGALGAPEVVLSRAERDTDGPTIPSRFLLRIEALLGETVDQYRETNTLELAERIDRCAELAEPYPRPQPDPDPVLRDLPIKVTALDRLLGDPYQFYASEILALRAIDPLDADPYSDPAFKGTLAHEILEQWHKLREQEPIAPILPVAERVLAEANLHPLMEGLWKPRLFAALEWVAATIDADPTREVVAYERSGSMVYDGVRVHGRADRIDKLADGTLAIADYKTGKPPSAGQVEAGFALQLGLLGLIAREGDFEGLAGAASAFEYWSLAKKDDSFGFVDVPMKVGRKTSGLTPDEFLPAHEVYLKRAITAYIKGREPFTARLNPNYPGYDDYDQLMRLEEWLIRLADSDGGSTA